MARSMDKDRGRDGTGYPDRGEASRAAEALGAVPRDAEALNNAADAGTHARTGASKTTPARRWRRVRADSRAQERVPLGELLKPHGLKGEIGLHVLDTVRVEFAALRDVYLKPPQGREIPEELLFRRRLSLPGQGLRFKPSALHLTLLGWREHNDRLLLTLEGIENREKAELLRGYQVLVPAMCLPAQPQSLLPAHELEGLAVRLADGTSLGTLESVAAPTALQQLWTIRTACGQEVLFPAVPELVLDLNPGTGVVVIAPPPGLVELYLRDESHDELPDDADPPGEEPTDATSPED